MLGLHSLRILLKQILQSDDAFETLGIVPPKSVIMANLSSDDVSTYFDGTGLGVVGTNYEGWAICNGQNTTPDLRDKFPRIGSTFAGSTGGSDTNSHTHSIDHTHGEITSDSDGAHTHDLSAHTHDINHNHGSFNSGNESGHTHGNGDLIATLTIAAGANEMYMRRVNGDTWTQTHIITPSSSVVELTTTRGQGADVIGNTSAGSAHNHSVDVPALGTTASGAPSTDLTSSDGAHTHDTTIPELTGTSGAASNTENRPAFYELVALMRT